MTKRPTYPISPETILASLARRMWEALKANQRGELSELELLGRRRELWREADAAGLTRDLGARLTSQRNGRDTSVRGDPVRAAAEALASMQAAANDNGAIAKARGER